MANVFGMRSRNQQNIWQMVLANVFGECVRTIAFEKLRCVLDGTHCMVYITATCFL